MKKNKKRQNSGKQSKAKQNKAPQNRGAQSGVKANGSKQNAAESNPAKQNVTKKSVAEPNSAKQNTKEQATVEKNTTEKAGKKNFGAKKGRKWEGLNMSLIVMSIFPMLILGLLVSIFVYHRINGIMRSEIEKELKNTALIVQHTFDYAYEGDYDSVGTTQVAIVKGEKVLNGEFELIDAIKEETGSEITFFYGNTRIITTITDDSGERVIGTTVRQSVANEVLKGGESQFYDNIIIDGKKYFAFYQPVQNSDGSCVGMIAVLRHADVVRSRIFKAVLPVLMIMLVGMAIMAVISYRYAGYLIKRINRIKEFLTKTSDGDFKVKLDEVTLHQKDEISEMGRVAMKMQYSLRKLVEQDSLTEMNNRRYGDKILVDVHNRFVEEGIPFAVAIMDIDYFKNINDTYGHHCGDIVLQEIAMILKKGMEGKGFAARWGGEEFLLLFEGLEIEEAYESLVEIMENVRKKKVKYDGNTIKVTVTCGVTEGSRKPIHVIVKEADDKLYQGKENGRDRIVK